MNTPEHDSQNKDSPKAQVPSWMLMTGIVALVFEGEAGWTLLVQAIKTMNNASPDGLGSWSIFIISCLVLAVAVTFFSVISYRSRFWNGIVWSCLAWLVIVGLSFVLMASAPHAAVVH